MKFITVRDFRSTPAQIWKELPEEKEMVITNNGKPIALLTPINDVDLEESLNLWRKLRAMEALRKLQASAQKNNIDTMSSQEIEQEIANARIQE